MEVLTATARLKSHSEYGQTSRDAEVVSGNLQPEILNQQTWETASQQERSVTGLYSQEG